MATTDATVRVIAPTTTPDTPVVLKINIEGANRRFKLPLRDLGASTLPEKLRFLLAIPPAAEVIFERYSDSAASFVVLDPNNASVYKQLYRAAKAKGKLRLKATIKPKEPIAPKPATVEDEVPNPVSPVDEAAIPVYETLQFPDDTMNTFWKKAQEEIMPEAAVEPVKDEVNNEVLVTHTISALAAATTSTKTEPELPSVSLESNVRDKWLAELATLGSAKNEKPLARSVLSTPAFFNYSVYCNNCETAIPDEHYHCGTCDDGDFDLCQTCIDAGVGCSGEEHWMVKRFVKSGKVISSTTETLAPKKKIEKFAEKPSEKNNSFADIWNDLANVMEPSKVAAAEPPKASPGRICNSCVQEYSDSEFVSCTTCDDYDLCIPCHVAMDHGHSPKHAFVPATEETRLDLFSQTLLAPGRNVGHNAICDGCDKYIYGVRHKCLDCPDWDYCSACVEDAHFIHPSHRFVPIYEALRGPHVQSRTSGSFHAGIFCDGPLCNHGHIGERYISGDRYKCAVCNDVDFCSRCEASPANTHNRTHPLIKFKTPVRHVNVTTLADDVSGRNTRQMGDHCCATKESQTETVLVESAIAPTQVQTVADLQPREVKADVKEEREVTDTMVAETMEKKDVLEGSFIRDEIADGTEFTRGARFTQTWWLRNTGTVAWPAGCNVRFVGGDVMFAVDLRRPASVTELYTAARTNSCPKEILPGEEFGFTVPMKSPVHRQGQFISYWRLTDPDSKKFGHKLWCEIVVVDPKFTGKAPVSAPKVDEAPRSEDEEVAATLANLSIKDNAESESEGSQMIFPKLAKESPETAPAQDPTGSVSQYEVDEFEEFTEEPLSDPSSEDGFMTDEEYDILEASDEEYADVPRDVHKY